jgi:hypothetical protein
MGFGMCIQSSTATTPVGAISALADELTRRGLLPELLAMLDREAAGIVRLRITVDRQRVRRARTTATG